MASVSVIAGSPVSVITNDGKQHGIPLSLLAIRDGAVDTSRLDPALAAAAAPSFKALLASGALRGGTVSAPVKAMEIVAKLAGEVGNGVTLTFSNVKPDDETPEDSTADVKVTFTDRREGLTVAAIGDQLGAPAGGTEPSLVTLKAPAAGMPKATAATKLTGNPRELAVDLDAGGGTAFTLKIGTGALNADVTAGIEDVDTAEGTFTLVIALEHTAADIALSALAARLAPLATVTPGAGGFAPPATGTVTLRGGTPARTEPPAAARAEVLSG